MSIKNCFTNNFLHFIFSFENRIKKNIYKNHYFVEFNYEICPKIIILVKNSYEFIHIISESFNLIHLDVDCKIFLIHIHVGLS